MNKLKAIAFLSILLLIALIPQSFAMDNETAVNATDIYFDANAAVDGDGSVDNPYNNFTNERIRDNSTIHLAGGDYFIEDTMAFQNVSFYGSSAYDTVLNGNEQMFIVYNITNFRNITLTNFMLVSFGSINAANTHFTEMIPSHYYDPVNDYGGAVSAFENVDLYFDNCTFFNNEAQYGGAIHANGGNLTIMNSLFYNNLAYEFGGAILTDRTRVIINNTRFIANTAIGDAGGAIYLINSTMKSYNMTISDCSATYGGGITALLSCLDLANAVFQANTAEYDGGAIYQFYGSLNLNSSRIISNTAKNGAGIFTDDVNLTGIIQNEFINNTASDYGGAVYSFLNSDYDFSANVFENNTALEFKDVFTTFQVNLNIGDGNYTMYVLNQTSNSTIPSSYDLRRLGLVTPVKDQLQGGNCWAFAAIAALESCVLKASGEVLDLSEENMKNLMAMFSDYGRKNNYPNSGGTNELPIAYLVSWLGPVNESDDEYDDVSQLSPVLKSLLHVQNVIYLKRDNYEDNDAIKMAVMDYGAVATNMYYDNNYIAWISDNDLGYYFGGNPSTPANHAVTIVGWDDSVRLRYGLERGAWIVRNSWGPEWGYDGYFYVSYYDSVFAKPGTYGSYTFILNDTQHFDKSYQYDISGVTDYFYVPQSSVWYENAFNVTDDEFLAGVSTYFEKNTQWELYIYINSRLQLMQTGSAIAGYYTINLDYPVPMAKGDVLEILFRIAVNGSAGFPISEAQSLTKTTYGPMQSFVSLDGVTFYQLHNLTYAYPGHIYTSQVACIKGFVQFMTLNATARNFTIEYDSCNLFNITVDLTDENGNPVRNGNVTFTVNGENRTSEVYNGIASIQIPLPLGQNSISWSFASPNYCSLRGNATYEVLPVKVWMNITVIMDLNDVYVNLTLSQPLDENFTLSINGINQTVRFINATFHLDLTNLDYGQYDIIVSADDEFYDCANSTGFFVDVKRTHVNVSDMETFYGSGEFSTAVFFDEFGEPLRGVSVRYVMDDVTYVNFTDDEGRLYIPLDFDAGNFTLDVFFEGDDHHVGCQNSSSVRIDPSRTTLNISSIVYDSLDYFNIIINAYDQLNRPIDALGIAVTVNDENHMVYDGMLRTRLVLGKNSISVFLSSKNYLESSCNASYEVTPVKLEMEIEAIVDFNNAFIELRVSQPLNENVTFIINGKNQTVRLEDGRYGINLTGLEYGEYAISAQVDNKFYDCRNSTGFFVDVKKTFIRVADLETVYNSGAIYSVQLFDQFGKPVTGREIRFMIGGNVYCNITDENGTAGIAINLANSDYQSEVIFEGDDTHIKSRNSSLIVVRSSIRMPSLTTYTLNSDYEVYFLNKDGTPLNNTYVTFTISGRNYNVLADAGGRAVFAIPFDSGNFRVNVLNTATGEILSQDITVVKRITQNRDMSFYYGNYPTYKIRVCADNGQYKSGLEVKFTLNKKIYYIKTDNNGYASLKISLPVGKYTVTAEYKGFKVSNKITIKTTLITKNKKAKKGKTVKFTAKLLNKNGKALKGKKIKFKVKGKTYKAKTNRKGIATIKIKHLKVGKHKVISSYGRLKSTSYITIKK